MIKRCLYFFSFLLIVPNASAQIDPVNLYGELFFDVQVHGVFKDSKTFVDCTPKKDPMIILTEYRIQSSDKDFNLKEFVLENFDLPGSEQEKFVSDTANSVESHIQNLWEVLSRAAIEQDIWTSLINLPHNYIVPGGRFREIYYWDTYFTMLGLSVSGHEDIIKSILDNIVFLINEYGFIPNGNRTYYLTRSQPPFFSLMVELWGNMKGENAKQPYLPALVKEYEFWMNGMEDVSNQNRALNHVVRLEDGVLLNRYWDYLPRPRPESFKEDFLLAQEYEGNEEKLYTNLRAAAESGWDFSSRWFSDNQSLKSVETINILPVDLNCLLYHLELTISNLYFDMGNNEEGNRFLDYSFKRKNAILKYFWDNQNGYFTDYDFVKGQLTGQLTMATAYPLFFTLADRRQAKRTSSAMLDSLEAPGGFMTTLINSGQQWDKPNGWPPLQYIGIMALKNYGYNKDARRIANKWLSLNERIYSRTGKMMEKYNVVDMDLEAGGGEYPLQDGFGWTNGVYMIIKKEFSN